MYNVSVTKRNGIVEVLSSRETSVPNDDLVMLELVGMFKFSDLGLRVWIRIWIFRV